MGTTAIASIPLITNQTFIGLVPRTAELSSEYLYWALQGFRDQLNSQATGAIQQYLSRDDFRQLRIPIPPCEDQVAIVRYLDDETNRIDNLIAQQSRMAALVLERRDAVIRTATRMGIRGEAVTANDTPWIGEVPEGWQTLALKRVGRLAAGMAFPEDQQGNTGGPIPYLKVGDLTLPGNEEYLKNYTHTVTTATARRLGSPIFPPNTIVFPKIGAALLSNRRRITVLPSCTDQNLMGLIVEQAAMRYLYYLLQTLDFSRLRMPGPVPLLNERDAADLIIPLPPFDEQVEIAEFLDLHLGRYNQLLALLSAVIARMEERRRTLITLTVTGPFDVPGLAA